MTTDGVPAGVRGHRRRIAAFVSVTAVVVLGVAGGAPAAMAAPPQLTEATVNLPDATVGQPYNGQITITDGTPPYTFTVIDGTVPPGLTVSSSGLVEGTPVQQLDKPVTSTFGVHVSDSSASTRTLDGFFYIVVRTPGHQPPATLALSTDPLPPAMTGQPYSATIHASGGTPPFQWLTPQQIPDGLMLTPDGAELTISGTPTQPYQGTITLTVVDGGHQDIAYHQWIEEGQGATRDYAMTVTTGDATTDQLLTTANQLVAAASGLTAGLLNQLQGGPSTVQQLLGTVEPTVRGLLCTVTGLLAPRCLL
jgi:hypothetical protein